eukprot:1803777-Alexandrium_andersonii.AAC.1
MSSASMRMEEHGHNCAAHLTRTEDTHAHAAMENGHPCGMEVGLVESLCATPVPNVLSTAKLSKYAM